MGKFESCDRMGVVTGGKVLCVFDFVVNGMRFLRT